MTVPVLYLAGWGRSGTTFLSSILGSLPGYVAVGELRSIWTVWMLDNLCGCGAPVRECELWAPVLDDALGIADEDAVLRAQSLQGRCDHTRYLGVLKRGDPPDELGADLAAYRALLSRLYRAVATRAQAQVVVDSSKLPAYAAILEGVDGLDVKLAQVVRDPRANAFSWRREKVHEGFRDGRMMPRYPAWKSAVMWDTLNRVLERHWSGTPGYRLVRYEDFVADPVGTVQALMALAGVEADSPFDEEGTVLLAPQHQIHGNPNKHTRGRVGVREDDAWRGEMKRADRLLVTAITLPWLRHYGYRTRG